MEQKIKISKELLYEEYCVKEKSLKELCNLFDCSVPTIYNYLKKYNIPTNNDSVSKVLTKDFLEQEYIINRKSYRQIAKETGFSNASIYTRIIKFKLERRSLRDSSHILTKEYLEEHYVRQNKSLRTIVEEIGFKRKSIVKDALIKHGIPLRAETRNTQKQINRDKSRRGHHTIRKGYINSLTRGAIERGLEFDVDVEYLWGLFEQQNERCAISGVPISFPKRGELSSVGTASLDRIDSEKGYIEGNVQWVHKTVNKIKLNLNNSELISWCEQIYIYNNRDSI